MILLSSINYRKIFIACLALLVLISVLIYAKYQSDNILHIAISAPMRSVSSGEEIVNGARLALEEVGYRAGKSKIVLDIYDEGDEFGVWSRDIAIKNIKEIISSSKTIALLGSVNSGVSKIIIPYTNQAGMLQISPANTWPGLTKPGFAPGEPGIFYPTGLKNYFRVIPNDISQGIASAKWAKDLNFQTIYIFDDGGDYGKGIADVFHREVKRLDLKIVGRKTLSSETKDFSKDLEPVKNLNPDLIYFGGVITSGAPQLIKQIKDLGIKASIMAPEALLDEKLVSDSNQSAIGMLVTSLGAPAEALGGKGLDFYNNYLSRYKKPPQVYAPFAYEATKIIIEAIEATNGDKKAMIQWISDLEGYNGILGEWGFDEDGDTTLSLVSGNRITENGAQFIKLLPLK